MLKHGRAGVPMEVMGLMLGEFIDDYTVSGQRQRCIWGGNWLSMFGSIVWVKMTLPSNLLKSTRDGYSFVDV